MRIAIVHPWYVIYGGAEQTVKALASMYPEADFFTLFYYDRYLPSSVRGRSITPSSWNWLPTRDRLYRYLLPFYPLAFESLDLRGYDLILTSDSCVAKGILTDQHAVHVCYCHSPMRCLWDLHREFSASIPRIARPIFTLGTHYVRQWDYAAAQRVDAFVANSKNVAERIWRFYRRESRLIYPPVDTKKGYIDDRTEDYYLSVGRLTGTKRIDLLIAACNKLKRKLVIAGVGREERRLKAMAGPTIEFAGRVSDRQLGELYSRCRAFLFAAAEDFGIVPVEAQSFGRPVIAYGHGGSLETVIGAGTCEDGFATGLYFREQTAESLQEAILKFERVQDTFNPLEIQKHAARFDTQNFVSEMASFVEGIVGRGAANWDWPTSIRLEHDVAVTASSGLRVASIQRRS